MKHLVTSGCSYSAYETCWPTHVSQYFNLTLYNLACASAGNDWIMRSSIFAASQLMKKGIPGEDILLTVLWTHPDRKSFFVDVDDTSDWHLLNEECKIHSSLYYNPVSFIDANLFNYNINNPSPNNRIQKNYNRKSAWVIGNSSGKTYSDYETENDKFRGKYAETYFTKQGSMIELFENILQIQWFCKYYNIQLLNLYTEDRNLFSYPNGNTKIKETYENIRHLIGMVDFSLWCKPGLIEYSRYNNLPFLDSTHPAEEAHKSYAQNVIIPLLKVYFK